MHNSEIQEALHKAMNEKTEKTEKNEIQQKQKIVNKDSITLIKTLPKDKGYVLKLNPSGAAITRKLKDIYWLQTQLMVEFPYYYVR